jgi:hypothetical protein
VQNDQAEQVQTCWTTEGEDFDRSEGSAGGDPDSLGTYSGGNNARLDDTGDVLEWDFVVNHTIPAENFNAKARQDDGNDGWPAWTWYVEINGIRYDLDSHNGGADIVLGWDDIGVGSTGGTGYDGPDVPPGTHTLGVELDDGIGSQYILKVDVVAPYDDRYNYFFDNDNGGSGGYLDGPELYGVVDVKFDAAASVNNVAEGRLASTWNDTSNDQAVAISNDGGETHLTASNTTSIDRAFSSGGASISWRATMSRYGSRTTATPQQGFNGQAVTDFTLYATLTDSPVLANQSYEGDVMDILQQIADYGSFVFEVRWDTAAGGLQIEWTQPGLRTASRDPRIEDYNVEKHHDVTTQAVIKGGARRRHGERFAANHGTSVALDQDHLIQGRESVYDRESGEEYERGPDYTLEAQNGAITTLSDGGITDGQELAIDYDYKVRGNYSSDAHGGGRRDEVTETIPSISTDRGCRQAAKRIVDEAETPLKEASATLPEQPVGLSLVEALDLEGLPTSEGLEVWSVENQPGQVTLQLGSRKRVEESIRQIRTLSEGTSERV